MLLKLLSLMTGQNRWFVLLQYDAENTSVDDAMPVFCLTQEAV